MPTLSEMQTKLPEILDQLAWDDKSEGAALAKENSKNTMFKWANNWQKNVPDENVYDKLLALFNEIFIELLISNRKAKLETYKNVEIELANIIAQKLQTDLENNAAKSWSAVFIQLSLDEVATLIRQISYGIRSMGWAGAMRSDRHEFLNWIKDKELMKRATVLSEEESNSLIAMGSKLTDSSDPSHFSIPEQPLFCLKSDGEWCIFDQEAVDGMLQANHSYRQRVAEIDESGPTGIGYSLEHLPDDRSKLDETLDHILLLWHGSFPMDNYTASPDEESKREILNNHEKHLDKIERLLDRCIWEALPDAVRQIVVLRKQRIEAAACLHELHILMRQQNDLLLQLQELRGQRAELGDSKTLDEEKKVRYDNIQAVIKLTKATINEIDSTIENYASMEDIQTNIEQIDEQLQRHSAIEGQVTIESVKNSAFELIKIQRAMLIADNIFAGTLLSYLSDEQLVLLVNEAANALVNRGYNTLPHNEDGQVNQHLTVRRSQQLDERSTAEENLFTASSNPKERDKITETRVRDPINRKLFVEVGKGKDGCDFCGIIIGGCLLAKQLNPNMELSSEMIAFVEERTAEDPSAQSKAILQFIEFRIGNIKLPDEQKAILEQFNLTPRRSDRFDLLPKLGRFAATHRDPLAANGSSNQETYEDRGSIKTTHV